VTRIICGVDVASSSLAARIGPEGIAASFANNPEGIAALAAFCHMHQVELIAMEATGGYEQQALAQLSAHNLPVAILNPRAVRQFAQSMGRREKTDAIDAASSPGMRKPGSRSLCAWPHIRSWSCAPGSRACASSPRCAPRS
jgi:transposase